MISLSLLHACVFNMVTEELRMNSAMKHPLKNLKSSSSEDGDVACA